MGWVLIGCLVFGCLVGALVVIALRKAIQASTTTLGEPTPEEAKIKTDTDKKVELLQEQSDQEQQEVMHASRSELLARLRDLVRGKK